MTVGITFFFGSEGFGITNEKSSPTRNKGKSLIDLPDNYTLIDLETTGLTPYCDEIIELSALKIRNNKIVKEYSRLVKPDDNIDSFITELTGITNQMLKTAPNIESVLQEFIDFISDDIVVGYNVNFDINFIYDNYFGLFDKKFKNNFVDLMRICKKVYNLPNHKLKTVADSLNICTDNNHRGLKDCYITFEVYNHLKSNIFSKYETIKDFYKANWASANKLSDNIVAATTDINTNSFFYNKTCVFTGTLNIPRKEAMQLVVNNGGHISDSLNKQTNILIVGFQDYTKTKKIGKSNKIIKAETYILKGQDLLIIPESEFYQLINEEYE